MNIGFTRANGLSNGVGNTVCSTFILLDDFLNGNVKSLFGNVKQLSKVVFDNFKPMIPQPFHKIWEKGIESNDYYLKLCGSGGGGYILGFTQDFNKTKTILKDFKLELVYRF